MTVQVSTHVKLICDLQPGDVVRINGHSQKLNGKDLIVEEVVYDRNCESRFMVSLKNVEGRFDSNWLIKVS